MSSTTSTPLVPVSPLARPQKPSGDQHAKRTAALLKAREQGGTVQPDRIVAYIQAGEHLSHARRTIAPRSVTGYIQKEITPLYTIGKTHTMVWEKLVDKFGREFLLDTTHLSIPSSAYVFFSQQDIPVDIVKQVVEEIRSDMIPYQYRWGTRKIKDRINYLIQEQHLAALPTDSLVDTVPLTYQTEDGYIFPETPLQPYEERKRTPRSMVLVAARGTRPRLVSGRGPQGEVCIVPEDCLPEDGILPLPSVQAMKRYVVTMANNFALYVSRQKVRANGAKGLVTAQSRIQTIKQEQEFSVQALGRHVVSHTEVYAQERSHLIEYLRKQHYIVAEFSPLFSASR